MVNLRTERAEEVRHVEFRAPEGSDGQTLEGYAAVFNAWTDIRDALGTYREQIAPGAFKRSLGQRQPVLQFDHGQHPLIGSIPLGTLTTAREDRNGLFVQARLSDNWLVQPIRDAIKDRAISGMSFRFRVIEDSWVTDANGNEERTIKEVELLELGPVVFPAYTQTSVVVRSLMERADEELRNEIVVEVNHNAQRLDHLLKRDTAQGTSIAAMEPAEVSDGPAEPPVVSRDNHQTIQDLLTNAGLPFLRSTDVSE